MPCVQVIDLSKQQETTKAQELKTKESEANAQAQAYLRVRRSKDLHRAQSLALVAEQGSLPDLLMLSLPAYSCCVPHKLYVLVLTSSAAAGAGEAAVGGTPKEHAAGCAEQGGVSTI